MGKGIAGMVQSAQSAPGCDFEKGVLSGLAALIHLHKVHSKRGTTWHLTFADLRRRGHFVFDENVEANNEYIPGVGAL
jgi:hypothetical protein